MQPGGWGCPKKKGERLLNQPEYLLLLVVPAAVVAFFATRRQRRLALDKKLRDSWGSATHQRRVDPDNIPYIA